MAEVFEALARLEEVFHGHEECGLCKNRNVGYQVRQDKDGNKYYQAVCLTCRAEFRFGVRREPPGCLFPQRKDADGNWKPNGGWLRYEPPADAAPAKPAAHCRSEPPAW